ncbi:MAG TPA: hypothetical protein VJ598_10910 [Albitalea sp.]|nr:hypothetical protein [Albitalea sp.]
MPTPSAKPMQIAQSLAERKALAATLLTKRIEGMSADELDTAAALVLGGPVALDGLTPQVLDEQGRWCAFSPTRCWDDYGALVTRTEVVAASHELYEDAADSARVTGYWFDAHAYFGGTSYEGRDLRETVARACAALLEHSVQFSAAWGNY